MTVLFDTHCHLQDHACLPEAPQLVERARAAGVAGMLLCGYDRPSNALALDLASRFDGVFPAVGYHPHDVKELDNEAFAELEAQSRLPEVVAIGEIGLDFYRDLSPRDVQLRVLERQLGLALATGKPVSVHSRAAEDAIFAPLAEYARAWREQHGPQRPPGVMHCFGGTLTQAHRFVDLGLLVSIACSVTYPKNEATRELARALPLDSLVAETDAPYLPPQGKRGQQNEPANVRAAVEAIASARGQAFDAVASALTGNAQRVFAVKLTVEVAA